MVVDKFAHFTDFIRRCFIAFHLSNRNCSSPSSIWAYLVLVCSFLDVASIWIFKKWSRTILSFYWTTVVLISVVTRWLLHVFRVHGTQLYWCSTHIHVTTTRPFAFKDLDKLKHFCFVIWRFLPLPKYFQYLIKLILIHLCTCWFVTKCCFCSIHTKYLTFPSLSSFFNNSFFY